MTRVKEHAKKHGVNYVKLIGAITALTAAVNGYLDLAKQNELMLQALGSKLNGISLKVAFLEGKHSVETAAAAPAVEPASEGAAEDGGALSDYPFPVSKPARRPASAEPNLLKYLDEARAHLEETGEHSDGGPTDEEIAALAQYMMLHSEGEPVAYVEKAAVEVASDEPMQQQQQMQIQLDAYDEVPMSMDALEEQAQEQAQEPME